MVKRRRGNASLSVRGISESKDESERVPLDDVSVARDRLRGALHLLLDPLETCGNDEFHKNQHSHKRKQDEFLGHLKQEQIMARQEEKKAALAARRKQRRAEMSQVAYHNTFVMKLFDRSVDLAQFKEGTPLYPICRAWMANQPRLLIREIKRSSSPVTKPKEEPLDDEQLANGEGMDVDGSETESDLDLAKDTYSFPPPIPLTFVRYPIHKPEKTLDLDAILNDSEPPSKEVLLKDHISKWTEVRNSWIQAANENEERFKQSKRILKAIYEKAQKAFE